MSLIPDSELKTAPNFEAILEWVDKNRPDCSDHIRYILSASRRNETTGNALTLLLVLGFVAGRNYQNKYPSLNPDWDYHRSPIAQRGRDS